MIRALDLTRRRFVALVAMAVGLLMTGTGVLRRDRRAELGRWLGLLRSPESAAVVGDAYLARFPEHSSRAALVAELERCVGRAGRGVAALSDAELRRRLREAVRSDYACGRTVSLQGWVVSRSEARLCALHAAPKAQRERPMPWKTS